MSKAKSWWSRVFVLAFVLHFLEGARPTQAQLAAPSQRLQRDPEAPFRRFALLADVGPLLTGGLAVELHAALDRHHGPYARGEWILGCSCADVEVGYQVNFLGEGAAGLFLRAGVGVLHRQDVDRELLPGASSELIALFDWSGVALGVGGGVAFAVDVDNQRADPRLRLFLAIGWLA